MKRKPYKRRINGFWIYSDKPMKGLSKRKVSPLLDAYDKMSKGQYMSVDLYTARLIRAMVVRRDYSVEQKLIKRGSYRMIKR